MAAVVVVIVAFVADIFPAFDAPLTVAFVVAAAVADTFAVGTNSQELELAKSMHSRVCSLKGATKVDMTNLSVSIRSRKVDTVVYVVEQGGTMYYTATGLNDTNNERLVFTPSQVLGEDVDPLHVHTHRRTGKNQNDQSKKQPQQSPE